jgi:hypothetical protein
MLIEAFWFIVFLMDVPCSSFENDHCEHNEPKKALEERMNQKGLMSFTIACPSNFPP